MTRFIGVLIAVIGLCSFKPVDEFSTVPEISLEQVNPDMSWNGYDEIRIRISYFDGDGDIGPDPFGGENLIVTDTRQNKEFGFVLQDDGRYNERVGVQNGEIEIFLHRSSLMPMHNGESVVFSIQLNDRSGNPSNVIYTPAITLNEYRYN